MKQILFITLIIGSLLMAEQNDKRIELDGEYLEAYSIAIDDFLKIKDLSDKQKRLKYYTVNFSENNESYFIQFVGKIMSEKDMATYNRMIFGKEVRYCISKKDFNITERLFGK
jgi:hypothetical protein